MTVKKPSTAVTRKKSPLNSHSFFPEKESTVFIAFIKTTAARVACHRTRLDDTDMGTLLCELKMEPSCSLDISLRDGGEKKGTMSTRISKVLSLLFMAAALGYVSCNRCSESSKQAKNIVLIVLDAMRNDHISLCGYPHRNSPNLERFAAMKDATHTCKAVAPASWTLPSHASYFTGVDAVTHGAHSIMSGVKNINGWGGHNRRLEGDIPTLAEYMDAKGYQTVAYSANPVVNARLGLMRGFQKYYSAEDWYELFGDNFMPGLKRVLADQDQNRPTFLFINIADAHQPWAPVPKGVSWSPHVPQRFSYRKHEPDSFWRTYVEGKTPEDVAKKRLEEIRAQYAWANHIADKNLGRAYDYLHESGWCKEGCQFIVVSDHGEFMGEHNLLDHGHYVYEGMVRVPLLVFGGGSKIELPEVLSAMNVHHLVKNRKLPDKPIPIAAAAWPHVRRCHHSNAKAYCSTSAAIWRGSEKTLFMDGKYYKYDLKKNPGETDLSDFLDKNPDKALLDLAKRVVDDREDMDAKIDKEVYEQLKALGYMD